MANPNHDHIEVEVKHNGITVFKRTAVFVEDRRGRSTWRTDDNDVVVSTANTPLLSLAQRLLNQFGRR